MELSEDYILSGPVEDTGDPKCDLWTYIKEVFVKNKDDDALVSFYATLNTYRNQSSYIE